MKERRLGAKTKTPRYVRRRWDSPEERARFFWEETFQNALKGAIAMVIPNATECAINTANLATEAYLKKFFPT
jgi:hypothetical protein